MMSPCKPTNSNAKARNAPVQSWGLCEGEPVKLICDLFTETEHKLSQGTAGYIINAPHPTKHGKWKRYVQVFLIDSGNFWIHSSSLVSMPPAFDPHEHNEYMRNEQEIRDEKQIQTQREKRRRKRQKCQRRKQKAWEEQRQDWAAMVEATETGIAADMPASITPKTTRNCRLPPNKYSDLPHFGSLSPHAQEEAQGLHFTSTHSNIDKKCIPRAATADTSSTGDWTFKGLIMGCYFHFS
jgi:hypothetical protein